MSLDILQPYLPVAAALIPVIAGVLGFGYRRYVGRLKVKIRDLNNQVEAGQKAVTVLGGQLTTVASERDHHKSRAAEMDGLKPAYEKLIADHSAALEALSGHERAAATHRNRVRKALELEGAIWTQPVMAGTFPFRPLAERRTPIVSVLNLKGGVGKTTLTAYLSWALAARGLRVLLVDLDLQGSLSSFFVDNRKLREMEDAKETLRHYLDAVASEKTTKLLDYAVEVPQLNSRSRLVATTDKLAYSELGQTFQWLLRVGRPSHQWNGRRDARMVLRRALHAKGLANKFDVVLLDCPPLVNLCCANALAASDFLLVPVTPNVKVIERVPALMRRVYETKAEGVNPHLGVLGMVVNRHQQEELTPKENDLLRDLPQQCYDILKHDVHFMDSTVPQRTHFRDVEDAFVPPESGSRLATVFEAMAEEFVKRLPGGCRQPPPARPRRAAEPTGAAE